MELCHTQSNSSSEITGGTDAYTATSMVKGPEVTGVGRI